MPPKERDSSPQELRLSLNDLMGKQSVRATFRLPKHIIELLSIVSRQLGIKQKTLFDQLVEDIHVLRSVAEKARGYRLEPRDRKQKTYVISRSSLDSLEVIARQLQVPRDLLVEISIKRLLPVIDNEREKHEKRKLLLSELEEHLEHARRLQERAAALLGKDDQAYAMLTQQVALSERNLAALSALVERGRLMEDW